MGTRFRLAPFSTCYVHRCFCPSSWIDIVLWSDCSQDFVNRFWTKIDTNSRVVNRWWRPLSLLIDIVQIGSGTTQVDWDCRVMSRVVKIERSVAFVRLTNSRYLVTTDQMTISVRPDDGGLWTETDQNRHRLTITRSLMMFLINDVKRVSHAMAQWLVQQTVQLYARVPSCKSPDTGCMLNSRRLI